MLSYVVSYRLTSLILGLLIAGVILILVRKDLLHTRYSIWWFFIALAIAFFGAFPWVVDRIASKFGVRYPPILLVIVGIGLILIKVLRMEVERSEQEQKIRSLAQRLAIYEGEILERDGERDPEPRDPGDGPEG